MAKRHSFIMLGIVILVSLAQAGEWPRQMVAYRGSTPVVDGVIAPGEYEDATMFHGVKDWMGQFSPTTDPNDLAVTGWVKHDGQNLYFAFDVTDDVLYGIDTDRWLPEANPKAHDFTRESFPWFGDGVELLINAANTWSAEDGQYGNGDGGSWQMVCNLTKSLQGGIGKGGLIQGEKRSSETAWNNYSQWIKTGAMQAVAKPKPVGKGYVIEWMIKPNPCLEIKPGAYWSPEMGLVKMGLNIGIQDLDQKARGQGNEFNFHHEDWWAGEKDKRCWLKQGGLLILNPEKKPRRRAGAFLGLHFDFHAGPGNDRIGENVTPEMVQRIVDLVGPDFIQVDTKGHAGYSSYPTNVGNPAPGFVKDQLKIWREVTARHQIPLISHYSGVWDNVAGNKHPDWTSQNTSTTGFTQDAQMMSVFGPYIGELMVPQFKELRREYGIDGVWVDGDCWAQVLDYSTYAAARFEKLTGQTTLPRKFDDAHYFTFMTMCRDGFREYLNHYVSAMHYYDPGFEVCSNWSFTSFMPEPVTVPVDYLSGDLSAHNGVNAARLEGRIMRGQGKPWDLMAWSFYHDFEQAAESCYNTKTAIQIEQEVAQIIALGGGVSCYFRQKGDGSIFDWQMKVMEDVARFCRERQAYCHQTRAVPQVAMLFPTASLYRDPAQSKPWGWWSDGRQDMMNPLHGVLRSLLDAQYSVEVFIESTIKPRLFEFPLVVVPECNFLDPDMIGDLLAYTHNGGHLLIVGAQTAVLFKDVLDVTLLGEPKTDRQWIEHNGVMAGWNTRFQPVELGPHVRGAGTLYAEQDYSFPSIPAASITPYGKGQIAAVYFDYGTKYCQLPMSVARDYMAGLVRELFPAPRVEVTGSHGVDVVVNARGEQLLVNLINTSGPQGTRTSPVFDTIPPIGPLTVTVNDNRSPRKVTLQPGNRKVKHTFKKDRLTLTVPELAVHDIVVIDY